MRRNISPESEPAEVVQVVDVDHLCPLLPLVDGEGSARAVVWPGIGAKERSMHLFALEEGSSTVEMTHPSEATYYVIEGDAVTVDRSDGSEQQVEKGSMIFVEAHTSYVISARNGGVRFVGGPCPPDPQMYEGVAGV